MHKALGAAGLTLALFICQPISGAALQAAVLTGVRLTGGPQATEVSLALDGRCAYSVGREGAGALEVRLPGAQAAPGLSTAGLSDERVKGVKVEASAGGLVVHIRSALTPVGYVHTRSGAGVTLRLFADAPGREQTKPKENDKPEAQKAAKGTPPEAAARVEATKVPKAPAEKPAAKAAKGGVRTAEAVKPPAAPPAAEKPAPSPLDVPAAAAPAGPAKAADSAPAPLLPPQEAVGTAARELAELPEAGPELGGLLPGTRPAREDEFLGRLLRTKESEGAYTEALRGLNGRDFSGALERFQAIQAKYARTAAAARAAYRVADCLFALAGSTEAREKARRAYLEAVSKQPLQAEVGRAYLQVGRLYQQGGYDYEALAYYGLTIKQQGDSPYALYAYLHRGDLYYKRGAFRQAQDEYVQVGRRYPNSARVREANFRLVRTLFAQGDYLGVERAYQEMRQRWPETFAADPQLLRYIGETYFQQGQYNQAREFLFYVLNIYPDASSNHLLLCRIADCFLAEGKQREADKLYRLLVSTFPRADGALLARLRQAEGGLAEGRALVDGLASGERRLGDLKLYEELAAGTGPMAQRARVRIGLWHYWRRDYVKAAAVLQHLLVQEKNLAADLARDARYATAEALYRQLRSYYEHARYGEGVKLHATWGKWFEGDRAETFFYLAECYRCSHLAQDAVRLYLKAQDLSWREDRRPENLYGLGQARLQTGDYAGAAQAFRQLTEVYPGYAGRPEAVRALGRASYLAGRYEAAVSALEEALRFEREPAKRTEDGYRLGLALLGLKDWPRAAAAFQEALSACASAACASSFQADVNLELGNALYAQERWDEAAAAYGRAARLAPGKAASQQALYKAGRCYVAMGRPKEARTAFGEGAAGDKGVWTKASRQMLDGLDMGGLVP